MSEQVGLGAANDTSDITMASRIGSIGRLVSPARTSGGCVFSGLFFVGQHGQRAVVP